MTREQRSFSIAFPHATLHGVLLLPAMSRGLVVFVAARDCATLATTGGIAEALHHVGFSTLTIDLLIDSEAHFADAETHLPHLAERLLGVISYLHRQMEADAIPDQPIGLVAAGDATPLAVRVAALRDKEIHAVVCHGGLVDLAGLQYLKVLQAPLLLIADAADDIASRNLQRAKPHIAGVALLERLPGDVADPAAAMAALTVSWFQRCLR
mgnify:FL=1